MSTNTSSLKSILKTKRRLSTASSTIDTSSRFSSVAGSCCSRGSSLKQPTRRPSLTDSCTCLLEPTADNSEATPVISNGQQEHKQQQPEVQRQEETPKTKLAKTNLSGGDHDGCSPRTTTTIRFSFEAATTAEDLLQGPPLFVIDNDGYVHHDNNNNNDIDLHSKPGEICFEKEEEPDDNNNDDDEHHPHTSSQQQHIQVPTETAPEEEEEATSRAATTTNASSSSSSSSSSSRLTEARVRSFMIDYYEDFDSIFQTTAPAAAHGDGGNSRSSSSSNNDDTNNNHYQRTRKECMKAFVDQYFTSDFTFIRPSGNPLDGPGFATLMAEHIVVSSMKLVSIDSIQFIGRDCGAIVVFTADQQFSFKGGKPQRDRTIVTAVLSYCAQEGGVIKIAHKHRSPGIPIPKTTRWA